MIIAYAAPPIWVLFVGLYLLVAIPAFFFGSVALSCFALFVARGRASIRRPAIALASLSFIHLAGSLYLYGWGDSGSQPSGFDQFLRIAAVVTPFLFVMASVLPQRGVSASKQ